MSGQDRPGRRRDLWDDDGSPRPAPSDRTTSQHASAGAAPTEVASRRNLHGRRGRFPWWVALLAVVLVLILCLGGAWTLFGGGSDDSAACGGKTITVAATPEIAEPLRQALDKAQVANACAELDVQAVSSSQTVKNINDEQAPDVWIPDSSTWVDAIDESASAGQWLEGQSIASSPIVLAVGSQAKGAPAGATSWTSIINDESDLQMANPDVDTASRLAFHASRVGEPGRIGLQTGKRLIFLSRFAAPSVNKLFDDYTKKPRKSLPFPASEQEIARFNKENADLPPLRVVAPDNGTLSLNYPWITNPELTGEALEAADRARAELGTLDVRESLAQAGFRDANGQGGPTVAGTKAPEITELEAPDSSERIALVEQWDIMRTDMRMLAVVDVSGSMQWDSTTPGMSRWEVTKGSLIQGTGLLPGGSEVGAWVFSSDRKNGQDHEQIAPVRPMNAVVGDGTHREHLADLVADGDKHLGGDTALYDTIWAAHQKMVQEYDPEFVNSIVVFTDGENDDPNGGLSLEQLLGKLDTAYDAKRPVRIITIGMGEADPTALQQIADETGGTSYIAETPDDIERVFVEALLARSDG